MAQTQSQQATSLKEHMLGEITRYQQEFQLIKQSMSQLQASFTSELQSKKVKYQAK